MKYLIIASLLMAAASIAFSPTPPFTVKGTVSDNTGAAIPGVSVLEKGTGNMTLSDSAGHFQITVTSTNPVLIFSAIGYENKELELTGKSNVRIILTQSLNELEEVVGTGLAPARKRNITGSVTRQTSPAMQLEGMPAGVVIRGASSYRSQNVPSSPGQYDQMYGSRINNFDTEDYDGITENTFLSVRDNPLSTFSIDVDAASYSNVRRYLNNGQLPPAGAVRTEELINYFHYQYPQPANDQPFALHTEISEAPWNKTHRLILVGLQARKLAVEHIPPSNLVFLIDVSGSMDEENKLPLVKQSMKLLADQLREGDKVSIVTYAGAAGLSLPATGGDKKQTIRNAIDALRAEGYTAGGEGIKLAYKIAREHFIENGNNRVILCTDGDFNVGVSSDAALERLIEQERKSGVFLTVLGYGMGNYKDNKMQKLADKGNGNHAYIDNINEAKKVLVHEFGGTLFTIAKDVKLQIEFNPSKVAAYRLIGYENRLLKKEDFNNDRKDAGELGSGHSVTALYEIIPAGIQSDFIEKVDPLKYQNLPTKTTGDGSPELMTIKVRYKEPDKEKSRRFEYPVLDTRTPLEASSPDFRFAAAVAEFGMLLTESAFLQQSSYNSVLALAQSSLGEDPEGYRQEFICLVRKAGSLTITEKERTMNQDIIGQR
ncbi:MAG: von Willebrand factor type A domain-containing protein [Chitinophagaceae bacterium]|nr:von Willebrand factor type A domain-containing protein [Chitinophagaceae bacterium]